MRRTALPSFVRYSGEVVTGTVIERIQMLPLWLGLLVAGLSGFLLTLAMPGFDVPLLAWVGMAPLMVLLLTATPSRVFALALPFGVVFSVDVHNWYPQIFAPALGYFLIVAVGAFYAGVLQLGVWLTHRLPSAVRVLGFPLTWSAVEFVKFVAPVVEDWWFVSLSASQWRFPAALQVLTVTGFPGLTFLIMLANVSVAFLVIGLARQGSWRAGLAGLAVVAVVVGSGACALSVPTNTFRVAVVTDMVNQDPRVLAQGEFAGTVVNDPAVSQAIFNVDAELTRQAAADQPAFVVWPENEFTSTDNTALLAQVGALAREMNSYIVVDALWPAETGLHDTAVLMAPTGEEVGRRAKINTTSGEQDAGIVPGPLAFPTTTTPFGEVGVAVCWDVHRLWIARELARTGAGMVLLPMDNDFEGTPTFPPFHAAEAVFRAAENRMSFALSSVNGVSMVVDPYGRITAEDAINQSGIVVGETFMTDQRTPYTRFGDWFGWLEVGALVVLLVIARRPGRADGRTPDPATPRPGPA